MAARTADSGGRGRTRHRSRREPSKPGAQTHGARRPRRTLRRFLLYWGTVLTIWLAVVGTAAVGYYAYDLPALVNLERAARAPGTTFVGADGAIIATYGQIYGGTVSLDDLPAHLPLAVLATEDRRFYSHNGLDWLGLARAALVNVFAGRVVQGGSTITQQVAKNVFLSPERSFRRKIQEGLLALWLERKFSKDELLTIYLNRVYLGAGTHGVEAASRRYFAIGAADLSLAQSAMIAGLLKAPSRYAPTRDLQLAQARAGQVLDNMVDAGWLVADVAAATKARPAIVTGSYVGSGGARYFADWLIEQLPSFVGRSSADRVVSTTLDPRLQATAEHVVGAFLSGAGRDAQIDQAALVAMDMSGAVKAMVGGRSYAQSQFNRATQAHRQPGSAFKLFVYLAALEAGAAPDQLFTDGPITIDGWSPRNHDGGYLGEITLRDSFALSRNPVAVQIAEQVGRTRIIDRARSLGITTTLKPTASLALGAAEVSLVELVAAYATVANGGRAVLPHGIVAVHDRAGEPVYRRSDGALGTVMSPAVAATMADLLRTVVERGTGRKAAFDHADAAGKTGTSQDFRDAWFIGYVPGLVAGVWLGNDDATPMDHVTGGGMPAVMWRQFMTHAVSQP